MTTQLAMFLANLFSRICSACVQFVIVVANQHAYLFSTCTIRAVLVLRSANQLNSGQLKSEPVWSVEHYITGCPTGKHELDVCAVTVLVVFFHNGKLQTEMLFLSDLNQIFSQPDIPTSGRQCETKRSVTRLSDIFIVIRAVDSFLK